MALCGVELEMVPVRRARAALSFFCSVTMDFAFLYHHYNHAQYTLLQAALMDDGRFLQVPYFI